MNTMIQEYHDFSVDWIPGCLDFHDSGGTSHFSWSELNGGFSNGNPHSPWGIVKPIFTMGLEATRTNYNRGGITLTSGYRCPHGNHSSKVGGKAQSRHMWGIAADMKSANYPWSYDEWTLLRDAAKAAAAGYIESYADDPTHLHADWR